jgi:hypothetical protein
MKQTPESMERGVAENISLSVLQLLERYTKQKFCVNGWYAKRDASWNIGCYVSTANSVEILPGNAITGKGVDFYAAVCDLRKNCIAFFADLYPDGVFKNLYDVELYLDGLFSVERNKVGAVIEDAQTNLNDLKDKFASLQESLLQLMKEMEKMTENGTVN